MSVDQARETGGRGTASEGPGEDLIRVPPAGEEIHMPGPTLIPIASAAAITLIVIGTTINWGFTIVGAVLLIICVWRWVADTTRDVGSLPEEHGH